MAGFTIIERDEQLEIASAELSSAGVVALDTEFMRVKTYAPVLCLVQLRGTGNPMLLDPLAIGDLAPLRALLKESGAEIVLHSCRQDLEALDTRIDASPGALFDTQVAAAFSGFGDQVSYAAMVAEVTGVSLPKDHTRADWARRPLPASELAYAADDVRYLHDLRDYLEERLDRYDRMSWFREECRRQIAPETWRPDPGKAWLRLKGAAALPVEAQETARRLAVWREQSAMEKNLPREWVLPTPALLSISRDPPGSMAKLARVEGISRGALRRYGDALVRICRETPRNPGSGAVWTQVLAPDDRRRVKGIMKLLRDVAEDIGISPSLLANRAAVEDFVRGTVEIELFRGWRREVAGDRVLADYS